jgi:hypothetical protein
VVSFAEFRQMAPLNLAVQLTLTLALALATDLERIENVMNFDPLVGSDTLQNGGSQLPFNLGLHRNGHSLEPRI